MPDGKRQAKISLSPLCSLWLYLAEHLQAEPIGHAGDVIAYHSLQAALRYETLKIARHKLRLPTKACEKLPKPIFDFARRLYQ